MTNTIIAQTTTQDQNFKKINTLFDNVTFYPYTKDSEYGKFIAVANELNKLFGINREFHIAKRTGPYIRETKLYQLATEQQKEQYLAYLLALHLAGDIVIAPTTVKGNKYNPKEKKFFDFTVNASYFDVDIIFKNIQNKVLEFVDYIKQKYDINLLFGKSRSGATRLMFIYDPIELKKAHYLNRLIVEEILEFFEGYKDKDNKILTRTGIKRTASNLEGKGVVVSLPCDFISNGQDTINFFLKFDKNIPLTNQYDKLFPLFLKLKNFLIKNKSNIKEIVEWATQEYEYDEQNKKTETKKVENKEVETKKTVQKEKINKKEETIEQLNSKIVEERKHPISNRIYGLKTHVASYAYNIYKKGNRNEIIRVLAAAYYFAQKLTLDETIEVLSPLLNIDEERESRTELIKRTYKRAAAGEPLEYKESFQDLFGKDMHFVFNSITVAETAIAALIQKAPLDVSEGMLATACVILGEMIHKQIIYEEVIISQNALAKRWNKAKVYVNKALVLLEEIGFIRCIEKSRIPYYKGGKGSTYEVLVLNENPKDNSVEEILSKEIKKEINISVLKELIELINEPVKQNILHYRATKHLDRVEGINAFKEELDEEIKTKGAEHVLSLFINAIKQYREKYRKKEQSKTVEEKLEFHEEDIFPF